jgi:hypothetical protein
MDDLRQRPALGHGLGLLAIGGAEVALTTWIVAQVVSAHLTAWILLGLPAFLFVSLAFGYAGFGVVYAWADRASRSRSTPSKRRRTVPLPEAVVTIGSPTITPARKARSAVMNDTPASTPKPISLATPHLVALTISTIHLVYRECEGSLKSSTSRRPVSLRR